MKKFKLLSVFLCSMAVTLSSCVVANPVTTTTPAPTTSKTSGSGSTTQPQAAVLQSISLSEVQTSYELGESFAKPIVTAHYSDKSSKNVTEKAFFTGYDLNRVGKQTVTVSYTENAVKKIETFKIEVSLFGWDSERAAIMRECLDDTVLPYIAGLWNMQYNPTYRMVRIYTQSYSPQEVIAVYENAGMTYIGDDEYGDPNYTYPSTHGTVTANVYKSGSSTYVDASYERALLSDWTAEDKEVMQTYLYDLVLQHPNGLWGEVRCLNGVDVTTYTKDDLTPENVAKTYSQNGYLVLLDQQGGYIFTKTAPSKEGETKMYVNGSIYVDAETGYLSISARASDTPEVSDTFYVTVDQSNPWVHDKVVLTVVRGNYYSDAVPEVSVSPAGAASYVDYDAGKFTYLINANSGKITFTVTLPDEGAKATVSVNVSTVGDWTSAQKAEQVTKLNGSILPFTPARWTVEDKGDTYFAVTTTDVTQAAVENTFLKDSRFSYEGSTSSGIEVYTYDDKYGVVAVGIYTEEAAEGEDYDSVHILSYFQQHAWDSEDVKIINAKLYGFALPHPLGEWHLAVSEYDGSVIASTQDSRITINDVIDAFLAEGYLVHKQPGKERFAFTVSVAGGQAFLNGYIYMSGGLPQIAITIGMDPILEDTFEMSADSYLPRGGDVVTVTITRGSYYEGDVVTLVPSAEGYVSIESIDDDHFAVTVISEEGGSVDISAYINGEDSGVKISLTILAYDWLDSEKEILAGFFTKVVDYNMPCFGIGWTLDGDTDVVVAQAEVTGVLENVAAMLVSSSESMYAYSDSSVYLLADGGIYLFSLSESEGFTYVSVSYVENATNWSNDDVELFSQYLGVAPWFYEGFYTGWQYLDNYQCLFTEYLNCSMIEYASACYSAGFSFSWGDSSYNWCVVKYDLTFEYTLVVEIYPTSEAGCQLRAYVKYHQAYYEFPTTEITTAVSEMVGGGFSPVIVPLAQEGAMFTIYDVTADYIVVVVKLADGDDINTVVNAYANLLISNSYFYYNGYFYDPSTYTTDPSFAIRFESADATNNTFEIVFYSIN